MGKLFGYTWGEDRTEKQSLQGVGNEGWTNLIREPYTGAWQLNDNLTTADTLSNFAVYAAVTLICDDIGKLRPMYQRKDRDGIWSEVTTGPIAELLRRPNRYQNAQQFRSYWTSSKLKAGNTYGLKERDARGNVVAVYVLDPSKVTPLISEDGSVYYRLTADTLQGVSQDIVVPASEIIHDRMCCLYHPLVGVPPLYANQIAAAQGNSIQSDSRKFFDNSARPSGLLVAPGQISDATATELKAYWDANFTGSNSGKVAVVGDGLQYQPMKMTALDAQLVDQLKISVDIVCATYHVPSWKIGFGTLPAGAKIEDSNQIYYSDCLQAHLESFELVFAEGVGAAPGTRVETDLSGLLRMDSQARYVNLEKGVGGGFMAPNEARKEINLPPIQGGDTVYLQQQNYSLEALSRRDSQEDPFSSNQPAPETAPNEGDEDREEEEVDKALSDFLSRSVDLSKLDEVTQ